MAICVIIILYMFLWRLTVQILKINVGDVLIMKKQHPCGNDLFRVLRVGSDVRIVCQSCGRDLTLDRIKLEKSVKHVIKEQK